MTQITRASANLGDMLRLPAHGERSALVDLRERVATEELVRARTRCACATAVGRGLLAPRHPARRAHRHSRGESARVRRRYFGIMRMGAVAVPVNHKLPRATIAHIFRDSAIELAFGDRGTPRARPARRADDRLRRQRRGRIRRRFLDSGPLQHLPTRARRTSQRFCTHQARPACRRACRSTHHGQLWAIGRYIEPVSPAEVPQDTTIVVAPLYHMNGLFNISRRACRTACR